MKKRSLIWIFGLILSLLYQERLDAYSAAVHGKIAEEAIKQNVETLNSYLKEVGLDNGIIQNVDKKPVRWWIEDGSWQEDYTLGVDLLTGHYYNPYTNKGLTEGGIYFEKIISCHFYFLFHSHECL